ncbi:MAG: HAMP domain-containing histidine kinase [Candidatus Latescibacterota bacterium]|nr:MAG: HAMP domain-containing histidine kinase [Candidatus Latescibacterota bacterium]
MEIWTDLAVVAHELGNALAPTRNAIQLLERSSGKLAPQQDHLLAVAGRGLERAERVLQNLSSLALLEEPEVRGDPTELHALLQELAQSFAPEAQRSAQRLRVHVQERLQPIPLDRDVLDQVLVNLVSNALKFSRAGGNVRLVAGIGRGVVLPGRLLLLAGGFGCTPRFVQIRVIDDGVGISEETRRRLFQPFYRGAEAVNSNGMGLGLAVSRRLVRLLHGDLRHEPRARGASFVVTLPADLETRQLVSRVDALTHELDTRLTEHAHSVALLRAQDTSLPLADVGSALAGALGDGDSRVRAVSDTTAVAWSTRAMREFAHALGAAVHQKLGAVGSARLRVALRRAGPGASADPLLLQAAVRCRHQLPASRPQREVSQWRES